MRTAAALASCVLIALGCGSDSGASAARIYTFRGLVTRLEPQTSPPQVWLRHEPIPDFVGPDGRATGMRSMEMPFPLAPGVRIARIAPGDKVEADLEVDWRADLPARLVRIETLPPETVLAFGQEAESDPGDG